jgi:RNA polymerase sigma factor (TIGR02999 family)
VPTQPAGPDEVARLIQAARAGDEDALGALMPLVYDELRRIARNQVRRERPGQTLQPTALVHEAYLRLVDQRQVDWRSRAHFFGAAAQVMRRILVDNARRRKAIKRGDGVDCVSLGEAAEAAGPGDIPVVALDDALSRLETLDRGLAQIVELRAFGGLTIDETAHVLKVSPSTVKREWRMARAWLSRELRPENRS